MDKPTPEMIRETIRIDLDARAERVAEEAATDLFEFVNATADLFFAEQTRLDEETWRLYIKPALMWRITSHLRRKVKQVQNEAADRLRLNVGGDWNDHQ